MWRRGKTLGQGAFGKVSMAEVITEEGSGFPTDMAVKSAAVSECRSLRHELRAFRDIQPCPHVIRCFGYNITMEQGVLLYNIFLELATGGSLSDLLHRYGGDLPVNEVRKYTKSVLMGLRHIHRQGLNKRKRVEEYTAKIADFGLAMKVGKGRQTGDLSAIYSTRVDKVPEIPCDLSMEARDFLGNCLIRDPKSRWTADMLLDHPFITGSIRLREEEERELFFPKQPEQHGFKKKQNSGEEDAQKEKPNADIALDMLRRYWCVERPASGAVENCNLKI
ncbi:unnamed protein product [Thlaspi arvense]|uniref:Protein kinase domain-containing protein n=1 Tax=Thlaspi arvense TaxID=13288 RepID=A0AAU9RF12_THLAR|nr:unnamed protein product [Thlaspi arvense]